MGIKFIYTFEYYLTISVERNDLTSFYISFLSATLNYLPLKNIKNILRDKL